MRGDQLSLPEPEVLLMGGLLAAAALTLLANDLAGRGLVEGYAVLAWLFMGTAFAYWGYCYYVRPVRLGLWTVLLVSTAVFFAAGGVVGPRSTGVSSLRA